jgi:hypothetical protein
MTELAWQKSSFSTKKGAPNCVEVASSGDGLVRLRESDCPGEILTVSRRRLGMFLAAVKTGRYDGVGGRTAG